MVNNKSAPAGLPSGVVNPGVLAAGSPGALNAGSGTTGNGGAGSTPAGNSGGGGAAAGSSRGAIPGTSPVRRGLRGDATMIASGVGTQLPDGSAMVVAGQSMDKKALLAAITAALAFFADVDRSAQALKSARLALAAATPGIRGLIANVRAALIAFFGKGNPILEAFGIHEVKHRPLTPEQLIARKAKAKATREQRGTLGKRQKQGVKFKGSVEVQTHLSGTETTGASPPGASAPAAGPSQP